MSKPPRNETDVTLFEALGQLKSVVEEQLVTIHDRLEHLAEVVREAVEEIGVLRDRSRARSGHALITRSGIE